MIREIQLLFTLLIALQFVVIVLHDLVDLPGWTNAKKMREVIGVRKLWLATCVNAIFPGVAVGFAVYAWQRAAPQFMTTYWLVYCGVTLLSAVGMWYVPYFRGVTREKALEYKTMYEGTRQVLPARGENPRPNLLHVCFHVLFVVNLGMAVALRFGR